MSNIYKDVLHQSLPRLINLYNLDPVSKMQGNGDRSFHGWKTQDFANGTFLGGIHALSIAYKIDLLESDFDIKHFVNIVFDSIPQYTSKNGSIGEAYPNENSFCVSALGAFDLLSTLSYLREDLSTSTINSLAQKCRPLIEFITKHGEEHAIISNHLATGVAAIALWNELTGEHNERYKSLLDIIYKHQSEEGWYKEYEGADPGYQTLCTYYLEAAQIYLKDEKLEKSIQKSVNFLTHFIHPDGTIGGLYGSRNTQVYYPGGLEKRNDNLSKAIAAKMREGIRNNLNVTPLSIDIGNLIPMINAYAFAAFYMQEANETVELPYMSNSAINFHDAGVYVHSNEVYYAIINYKKGGVLKVYNKQTSSLDIEDGGLVGILKNKQYFSTQQYQDISFDDNTLTSSFYLMNESYPSAITTLILRSMSVSIFRSVGLGNMFKKFIVKKLMTGKNDVDGQAIRSFVFEEKQIKVIEEVTPPQKHENIGHLGVFRSVHMASSTYNLKNTWTPYKNELVQFISK